MNHQELRNQQAAQLKVLADFDAFCREHELTYFMMYGTLLGAVRHHGFIPWDYDIDTAMTRAEYDNFRKVKHLLPSHLSIWEVCYSEIDHAGLARVMYNDEKAGSVCIDIFILDYAKVGNNKIQESICRLLHFAKLSKNEKRILIEHFSGQPLKQAVVQISKLLYSILGGSATVERMIYKMRVSKEPTDLVFTLEDTHKFPIQHFVSSEQLGFDGHQFPAPLNYASLLTAMYGNFMEIPPEGHQWMKEEGLE